MCDLFFLVGRDFDCLSDYDDSDLVTWIQNVRIIDWRPRTHLRVSSILINLGEYEDSQFSLKVPSTYYVWSFSSIFCCYRSQVRSLELSFQSVTVVVAKQSSSLQKICQSYNILFSKFFHVFFAPCQTKPSWKLNWIWRFWSFCYWIEVIPAVGSTIFSFQILTRLCDEETEV